MCVSAVYVLCCDFSVSVLWSGKAQAVCVNPIVLSLLVITPLVPTQQAQTSTCRLQQNAAGRTSEPQNN